MYHMTYGILVSNHATFLLHKKINIYLLMDKSINIAILNCGTVHILYIKNKRKLWFIITT